MKASLSWYKTESTWMHDLIKSGDVERLRLRGVEYEMYVFVMDQLGRLEERLLDLLADAEEKANQQEVKGERWTLVPFGIGGRANIAVTWLGVRAKALELVRQRDALGSRVLFAQMSMISS